MPNLSSRNLPTHEARSARLERLRHLTTLLDSAIAIPGTSYRIGLDPILGLIPGGGDTVGLVFSSLIVIEAARMGAPKPLLSQMVFNIVLETVVGAVPVVGDAFDFAWKSNRRNFRLLETHLQGDAPSITPQRTAPQTKRLVLLLVVGLVVAIALCLVLSVVILNAVIQLLSRG